MSVVQKGSSAPKGPVRVPEETTTSSPTEFIRRKRLSYPGGMRKASIESEIIQKLSKEAEPSSCIMLVSWTSLC
jgi:hypothetical protein